MSRDGSFGHPLLEWSSMELIVGSLLLTAPSLSLSLSIYIYIDVYIYTYIHSHIGETQNLAARNGRRAQLTPRSADFLWIWAG